MMSDFCFLPLQHYLAEMHRTDLPHQLLGQRLTIFGNIEKIFEFHIGQFLPELKRNCSEANDALGKKGSCHIGWFYDDGYFLGAQVAKCFLKYRTKFHLYALYNKNKPKSDALMAECASVFFRVRSEIRFLLLDHRGLDGFDGYPIRA